jgi:hypothetical protein
MSKKPAHRKGTSTDEVSALLVLEGGRDVENIWLKKKKGNIYEVGTIPFWAYNLSLGDLVEAEPDEDGEGLFINRVAKKSGNKTVRVAFNTATGASSAEGTKFRKYLDDQGLKYEIFEPAMIAVNVPSEKEYDQLVDRISAIPARAKMIAEDGDPQPNRNLDGSYTQKASRKRR